MTSSHLKWCPSPPNDVGRVAQHVREEEGRKEEKDNRLYDVIPSTCALVMFVGGMIWKDYNSC